MPAVWRNISNINNISGTPIPCAACRGGSINNINNINATPTPRTRGMEAREGDDLALEAGGGLCAMMARAGGRAAGELVVGGFSAAVAGWVANDLG